jgi:predicted O-methyltransferase YrrM
VRGYFPAYNKNEAADGVDASAMAFDLRRLFGRRRRADRWQRSIPDVPADIKSIIQRVLPYTMTSPERLAALCPSIEYLVRTKIPGDVVECGVWKGGSAMAAALALIKCGDADRHIYLFDTFDGMTAPSDKDREVLTGRTASQLMSGADKTTSGVWAYSPLDEAVGNLSQTGFPSQRLHFVQGKVEDTLPRAAPEKIALMRLDTDWYESTRHEMEQLFPRLSVGGVVIIDDYGHWQGSRDAVDEYIATNKLRLLLNRIDYTCRVAVKIE